MTEEMVAAGSRTAGPCCLHGYSAESEAFEKIGNRLRIPCCHTFRVRELGIEHVLKDMPCFRYYRFGAHQICYHPFCPGRNLGGQIGIAGSCHLLRCGGNDIDVGNDRYRSRTGECLLGIPVGNRSSERGITVDGSCGRERDVGLSVVIGRELAEIIDDSRTHGNGHRIVL